VTCRDMARTCAYYELLRFERERSFTSRDCLILWLVRDGLRVELFQFPATPGEASMPRDRPIERLGITHFCIECADLEQERERLMVRGVTCTSIRAARIGPFSYFFANDPDGNLIEFMGDLAC
jgi:catechol 2,3-dioxygenase-like lactoylglutathione lyase family enzyme